METKYNVGDTLWAYCAYNFGESFEFRECTVVSIQIGEGDKVTYRVRTEGYSGESDYPERYLYYTRGAAICGALEYIANRQVTLQNTVDWLHKQLEDA